MVLTKEEVQAIIKGEGIYLSKKRCNLGDTDSVTQGHCGGNKERPGFLRAKNRKMQFLHANEEGLLAMLTGIG